MIDVPPIRADDANGWSEAAILFKGPTELVEELLIDFRLRRGIVVLVARSVRSGRGRRFRVSEEGP